MRPPKFLKGLLAWVRVRRLRQQQHGEEEGAEISRRLQELLGAPKPKQPAPPSSKNPRSENDSGDAYRGKTGT